MKTYSDIKPSRRGFTLIEMIGVLAVIAILASLLIPKIYEAINNSRISNAALSYNTIKTALADHFAKYGSLLSSNGLTITTTDPGAQNFDQTLLSEGFLDKPFRVKIGDPLTCVVSVTNAVAAGAAIDYTSAGFDLDGVGGNDCAGSAVVQAVIPGVAAGDALALSTLLDGASLSASDATTADARGRVKYNTPSGGVTTVFIYVTHR